MPKVLVLYHSRTGNTAKVADAVAEGAKQVRFTEVDVRRIPELADPVGASAGEAAPARHRPLESVERLVEYDAIVVGSPTRFGGMSAELKRVFDEAEPLWRQGAFVDRVGSAFTSVGAPHGGEELALWSMMAALVSLGMILVPPGYATPATFGDASPYGAAATATSGVLAEADLAAARRQGERVATVVEWVTHAKRHHHHHH